MWSLSPGVGRKGLLKTAANIWVFPPLPPPKSFQKKYQVKSPPVDNPWRRQKISLLPTTQEEPEGSKDCSCKIYPPLLPPWVCPPLSAHWSHPQFVTFIHLCLSRNSYFSLEKVPLNSSTEMGELPQLCAGMKEASQSTCQAWLRAGYYRFPSSYFWRSEGLESWEDQGIAVSYRTTLPTAYREESSIYSLWDTASRSAGVWLVLSLPTASFPARKAQKSQSNPARAVLQRYNPGAGNLHRWCLWRAACIWMQAEQRKEMSLRGVWWTHCIASHYSLWLCICSQVHISNINEAFILHHGAL